MRRINRVLAVSIFILPVLHPQITGNGQPDNNRLPSKPVYEPTVDAETLKNEQIKRQNDSAISVISKELLTKDLPKLRKMRSRSAAGKPKAGEKTSHTIIGEYKGNKYELEYTTYKGVPVIPIDTFLAEYEMSDSLSEQHPFIDTVVKEYIDQRNGLQKAIDFLRKPFRKIKK